MRSRFVALIVVPLVFVLAPACKGTPSNVCKRLVALTVQKLDKYKSGKVTSDDKDTMEKNCVDQMEQMKKDAPNQYECQAACVNDVKDVDDLEPCIKKCPKNE